MMAPESIDWGMWGALITTISLGLMVVSLLISLLAIVGWNWITDTVKEQVRRQTSVIEERLTDVINKKDKRLRALLDANIGWLHWREYEVTKEKLYLDSSISQTQKAHDLLESLDNEKYSKLMLTTKNNLVHFYSERGDQKDAAKATKLVEDITKDPKISPDTAWLLSCAFAVVRFHNYYEKEGLEKLNYWRLQIQTLSQTPEVKNSPLLSSFAERELQLISDVLSEVEKPQT
ncbi:hypothetical protein ACTRXD_12115 [Nitrospira sp. T9]|uniref:hypothetical protein n=1 Tax=unclassified Nitrospira TaxID=2652172 RepID=UPI003F9CBBED